MLHIYIYRNVHAWMIVIWEDVWSRRRRRKELVWQGAGSNCRSLMSQKPNRISRMFNCTHPNNLVNPFESHSVCCYSFPGNIRVSQYPLLVLCCKQSSFSEINGESYLDPPMYFLKSLFLSASFLMILI